MFIVNGLTIEEEQVANKVNNYFKSSNMTMRDKVFHAALIAQQELDEHNFSTEYERIRIAQFKDVLDTLIMKLKRQI